MSTLYKKTRDLLQNESGATAVEYGLLLALMTLALIGALNATGDGAAGKWDDNADQIGTAMDN
ncbi:MAG: Flp family type IVb pilin [Henriciella sp.]